MSDDDESNFYVPHWNGFKVVQVDLRLPYDKLPVRLWETKKNHPILSKKEKEKELKVIEEKQESIEL
jgi:hypothetical protein|tara:strand:+ start:3864 stop:4064 length:201 start_codon:yes stop_codon:yes gene_type:complete